MLTYKDAELRYKDGNAEIVKYAVYKQYRWENCLIGYITKDLGFYLAGHMYMSSMIITSEELIDLAKKSLQVQSKGFIENGDI